MRAFVAFTKKELNEYLRNYKLFIMVILFIIIGILSPLTAKFMPKLIKSLMPTGVHMELPPPSSLDSWAQFFKNITQMGFIVMIIIFSGIMSREYEKGTLINMITKGLNRSTVVISKFTAANILWTISYWLSFFITLGYTKFYWDDMASKNLLLSVICVYIFGILIISIVLLGAVIFKSTYGSLLFLGSFMGTLLIANIFPKFVKYNPIQLVNQNINITKGSILIEELKYPICVLTMMIFLSIILSLKIFNVKQL